MEPHNNGRRGKESAFGIHRANQTQFLMLAMVATMVCVLFWETSPFSGAGVGHALVLPAEAGSGFEEQSSVDESPPLVNKPSEGGLPGLDAAGERKVEGEEALDTTVPEVATEENERAPAQENEPVAAQENEPVAAQGNEPVAAQGNEPVAAQGNEPVAAQGNEPVAAQGNEPVAAQGNEPVAAQGNEPVAAQGNEPVAAHEDEPAAVAESVQRASNETLAEALEEASSAEAETSLAELSEELAPVSSPEDLILDAALDSRPTAKPLEEAEAPSKGKRRNSSSRKCDYYVGKWVLDKTRPFYSGKECKRWLSQEFSCRRHSHPDRLLDRYRWQPAGCNLPHFNATAALEMLRNKVIAFVGDSLGRQQVQSLMCMLTRGKNDTLITDVGSSFGFHTPPGGARPNGLARLFEATNTTIIYKWSVTLARIQPLNASDPLTNNALHLDRPEQFIEDHIGDLDVLVLNSGHHWNGVKMRSNRFIFHLDGKPVSELAKTVSVAYNLTVHNVVRWVGRAVTGTGKVAYYRTLSPRHFRNGDWDTGGTCDNIRFQAGVQVQEGNRTDPKAESAVKGTGVNLLNITSLSFERGEAHMSKYGVNVGNQDCLHWCLPGIPDTWNEILLAELATKLKRRRSASTNL